MTLGTEKKQFQLNLTGWLKDAGHQFASFDNIQKETERLTMIYLHTRAVMNFE